MKQKFLNAISKQGIILTAAQEEMYINDFVKYCYEMEFTTEEEIIAGAEEYVICQIHYGMFQTCE